MAGYKQAFQLSVKEINLIEKAVRYQIHDLAQTEMDSHTELSESNHFHIMQLKKLLGVLDNQKIWYGETHQTGVPLG